MDILALVIAILLFLLGIVFTILPPLPGAVVVWAGMLVYGLLTGFANLPAWFLVVQGVLALGITGIDYLASALGSKYFGGSRGAFWGAIIGLFCGLLIGNLPGMIGGLFLGAFVGELMQQKDPQQAARAGIGALVGFLGGIPLKITLEIIMIIWFVVQII